MKLENVILWIVGPLAVIHIILIFMECWWSSKKNANIFSVKESLASLSTGVIHQLITGVIPLAAKVYFWQLVYDIAPYKFGPTTTHYILGFLLADLFYYLQHRLNHESPFFWSLHQAHHSSLELNLSTGARVSWFTPFFSAIFFAPIAFLGIHPNVILVSLILVFYGQWWCHTRLIHKVGFLEKILNTPSSHRVHHSPDPKLTRTNYAGLLIIWDRMLGTYKSEETLITDFGTKKGFVGYNPFVINTRGLIRYFKHKFSRNA